MISKIGIEQLEAVIDRKVTMEQERERKQKIENAEFEHKVRTYWEKDQKMLPAKNKILEKTDAWRKEFVKTPAFEKVFKGEGEVVIFYGDWGHEVPRYGQHGCWSRVYMDRKGGLSYTCGYKWYGGCGSRMPESEFARKLSHDYLKSLLKDIESGQVYGTMAKFVSV